MQFQRSQKFLPSRRNAVACAVLLLGAACSSGEGEDPSSLDTQDTDDAAASGGTPGASSGGSVGEVTGAGGDPPSVGANSGSGGANTMSAGGTEMSPESGGASAGEGSGGDSEAGGGAPSTGGAPESGGAPGAGGSSPDGVAPDCNTITDRPIVEVPATYSKVQEAINSIAKTNTTPTIIRIAPGTYKEKLLVDRPNITLCGQLGKEASTKLTYNDGNDTPDGNGGTLGTTGSRSTYITANDVSAENLTFENTRGVGTQAVALLIAGDRVQFRNSRFIGNQDTLYTRGDRQYFRDCYIEGTVDYIFGDGTAVFDNCIAHNVGGGTAVTAPNTDQSVPYGIVFLGGQLTASSVSSGSMALGRNWGAYGAAAFIGTALGSHISAVGWVPMGSNTLATARFSEYQTTGPGANPQARAAESKQLSSGEAANYTVEKIFGSWTPSYSK